MHVARRATSGHEKETTLDVRKSSVAAVGLSVRLMRALIIDGRRRGESVVASGKIVCVSLRRMLCVRACVC
jgi:hypothetical protein